MKALYLKQNQLTVQSLPRPELQAQQALIRVRMAGICNTDLELVKGYMGFEGVPGHEFVGVVEEAPDASWVQKRVCGEINFGCGACEACRQGLSRHCPNRTVLGILNQNGAFAEYVAVPVENLHAVPETLPDEAAVFVEPVAAALEILEQVQIEPAQRVAVVGDGKLGLLIAQVLRLTGCELSLVGKHRRKLALAESWGISTHLADALPEVRHDLVVEASGSPSGFETALRLLRPRGTLVLKSTYHGRLDLDAAPIVIDEIQIVGSRCGPFAPAVRLLAQGLVQVEPLVEQVYPFDQVLKAFEHAAQPETLKVLVTFG